LRGKRGPSTVLALAAKNTPTFGKIFSSAFSCGFLSECAPQKSLQSLQDLFFEAAPVWPDWRQPPRRFTLLSLQVGFCSESVSRTLTSKLVGGRSLRALQTESRPFGKGPGNFEEL
jgi:hypothetical protein